MTASVFSTTPGFPSQIDREVAARTLAQMIECDDEDGEGICDGFRSPDQAIVRKRDASADADYPVGDIFGLGSSITSNFWLVPLAELEQVLEAVDQAVLAAFPKGLNNSGEDAAITAVWLDGCAPVALVGCLGFGDWAAAFDKALHKQAYDWDRATWLAFGGNDNGPHSLLESCQDEDRQLPSTTLDLLFKSIVPSQTQSALEVWIEECPTVLAGWSPKNSPAGVRRAGQSPG